MTVWELTTNEGTYLVRCKPTSEEMYAYIKAKRAQGYSLTSIMFCWGPRQVVHRPRKCPVDNPIRRLTRVSA